MKLKVCGMRDSENILGVSEIGPDYLGFIFFPKSPRYACDLDPNVLTLIPKTIQKTGVFVNSEYEDIMSVVTKYGLDAVQLHGDETPELVAKLKQRGLTVIKVFRILDELPENLEKYDQLADFFLFDTKAAIYGGTGHHFNWSVLEGYPYETSYFLSGGLKIEDIELIKSMDLPKLVGLDVNSKFEIEPGLKDLNLIEKLKAEL